MGTVTGNDVAALGSVLGGIGITVNGVQKISQGDVANGTMQVVGGLAAIDLGAYAMELTAITTNDLMRTSLVGGAVGAIVDGTLEVYRGIRELAPMQILGGLGEAVAGGAIIKGLQFADAKIIAIAQRTVFLVAVSCQISYHGAKDFANGRRLIGSAEMGLGLSGMLFAGYCVFQEAAARSLFREPSLPGSWEQFLSDHAAEIDQLYVNQNERNYTSQPGVNFKQLGEGVSKKAFTHPDLSGGIVKISYKPNSVWGHGETDGEFHVKKLQSLRVSLIRDGYQQIALPNSFLARTQSGGPIVIEERVELAPERYHLYSSKTRSDITAVAEFQLFTSRYLIGDLEPRFNHNSGFLQGKENTIVIFDVDRERAPLDNNPPSLQQVSQVMGVGIHSTALVITLAERRFGAVARSVAGLLLIGTGVSGYQYVMEHNPEAPVEAALHRTFENIATVASIGIGSFAAEALYKPVSNGVARCARGISNVWGSICASASICSGLL